MLRERLNEALKTAMKEKDQRRVSTLRLILAALKDRDIAARPKGIANGIGEEEIMSLLQSMIKQRKESAALYVQGGRQDLVDQEEAEIKIIEDFLPQQMNQDETEAAITETITTIGAVGIKDMGKVMASLREKFAGRMDFAKASPLVKQKLS